MTKICVLVMSRVIPDGPVPSNLSMFQSACGISVSLPFFLIPT